MDADPNSAPWWAAGSVFALWATREIWSAINSRKKERTETDANVALVSGLTTRIEALEAAQHRTGQQLAEEMKLRMDAQEAAHKLRLRVMTLESAMRSVGAVIPLEEP